MARVLYRLGRGCARHRYVVLVVWLAIAIAVSLVADSVGRETSNNLSLPGTNSTAATDLLDDRLPKQANGTNPVVLEAPSGKKLTSGANRKAVNKTVKSLERNQYVRSAVSPLSRSGKDALSKDERIGYIAVLLTVGPDAIDVDEANEIIDAADPAPDAGLDVAVGGYLGEEVSKPDTGTSEVVGIVAAIIILLVAFGTAAAMPLPIVTALLAVVTGLSVIGLLGHVVDVPDVGPTLGIMIGLGVGIDYALFIVTRHRGFLAQGLPVEEAVGRAVATSGSAIVFAGSTVVIALCSLFLAGIPLVSVMGLAAAVVVVIAMAAAITLLPAILAILGGRIESLRLPFVRSAPHDHRPHGWARWAHWVARHAWPAMLAAIAVLAVLALPTLDLELGAQDDGELPKSTEARQAYDLLSRGFGPGYTGPLLIAVDFDGDPAHPDRKKLDQVKSQEQQAQQAAALGEPVSESQQRQLAQEEAFYKSKASDPRLVKLENKISKAKDVELVSTAKVNKSGSAAVFTATARTAPAAQPTENLVRELRSTVIPDAVKGTSLTAYVDGETAGYIDLASKISDKLPSVIAIVVALAFVLLLIAFRSVLVPLTSALMNLLSVAAAYGVLTAVFQKGWGAELIGLDGPVPIASYVPLIMFAILFGLSMDYQVFLVTRVREHYEKNRDNLHAVVDGLAVSGRVITSAALIMVCVFGSFILDADVIVKQFGVGLAVAIAIDATIIRCVLVPAVMVRLGGANWWLPGWLGRILPGIGIEGEDFLKDRPAPAPAGGSKPPS
ncbi:MAG TPA: MMPL family transporter [Solirubrobacterales bacterium]|nr:MMPL family transporter [Solirubrobacterales bacterium]